MIEVENLVYVMAGKRGRWYVTNGSTVQFITEIPKTMFDTRLIELENVYNDAVAYLDGKIYFTASYNGVGMSTSKSYYTLQGLTTQGKLYVSEPSGEEQVQYNQHPEPSGTNYIWYGQ